MNIILMPPADKELDDAIKYCNEEIPGLGDVFYEEFLKAADLLSLFPGAWRKVGEPDIAVNMDYPNSLLLLGQRAWF
jgi:hypothetical protein